MLKTNVHLNSILNSWGRKKVLQLIKFLFFSFALTFFSIFSMGIFSTNSVYVLLLVSDMTDYCGLQGQNLPLENAK